MERENLEVLSTSCYRARDGKNSDLHSWSIKNPWSALLLFLCLNLLFAWGNVLTQTGGILDGGAILNAEDLIRQTTSYVEGKIKEGFEGREMISFIIPFPGGIQTTADLQSIWYLTKAVKDRFGNRIVSLAEIPPYHDTGEALLDDPHITPALFTDDRFDLAAWKERVKHDATVYGILVGRQFDWAAVVRFLPPGYDETTEFRRTVEFLEGRTIPWWEWLWKTDLFPKDSQIMVGGWCIGRGLIDQGLLIDTIMLVVLGTLLTSHFLPIRRLGWIMGVMLVACAVGTLVVMAALLPSCVVERKESS